MGCVCGPLTSGFGSLDEEPSYESILSQNSLPFSPDEGRWGRGLTVAELAPRVEGNDR